MLMEHDNNLVTLQTRIQTTKDAAAALRAIQSGTQELKEATPRDAREVLEAANEEMEAAQQASEPLALAARMERDEEDEFSKELEELMQTTALTPEQSRAIQASTQKQVDVVHHAMQHTIKSTKSGLPRYPDRHRAAV